MKLNTSGTKNATLVVLVVTALLFVGLSAFAYPTLSSDDGTSETTNDNDFSNNEFTAAPAGEGGSNEDGSAGDETSILPPFLLHATPIDGDGDGIADDVIIYASTFGNMPLGGIMIYIDGIYEGATSFEGWLFATDFSAGYHSVRGLLYQDEAFTSFWVQGIVQPRYGSLKGTVLADDPRVASPTPAPIAGAKVEIFRPYPTPGTDVVPEQYPLPLPEIKPDLAKYLPWSELDSIVVENIDVGIDDDGTITDPSQEDSLRFYAFTTTDRNGEFAFEKLPAGRFMMRVTARGFNGHSEAIGITAGETTYTRIMLKPILPGRLNGFVESGGPVTDELGEVTDEIGPVPGARVEIFNPYPHPYPVPVPVPIPVPMSKPVDDPNNELLEMPRVSYYDFRVTDEKGAFAFEKVPAGTYMMRVAADGYHNHMERVTIKGGEVTSIRVMLEPVLPGSLKGIIIENDPTGVIDQPIAGAKVEIYTPYIKPAISITDSFLNSISSDVNNDVTTDIGPSKYYYDVTYTLDDGTFSFESVPEGKYAIRVTADGYLPHRGFVKIVEGETTELTIQLLPITWGTLKGLVYEDNPILPAFIPIKGATVEIYSLYPIPIIAVDDDVEKTKGDPDLLTSKDDPDLEHAKGDPDLMESKADPDLLVGIWTPFDPAYNHGADLADSLRYYARTKTDENGEFSFEKIPAGVYVIRVTSDGYEEHRSKVRITANEVTTKRIPLTRITTGILDGVVLGADPNGPAIEPIPGAKVEIFTPIPTLSPTDEELWNIEATSSATEFSVERPEGMPVWYHDQTFTGDNGAFEFSEVPEGTYMMRVTARGFYGYTELVTITANEITRVRVILKPIITGRLEGDVYGEEWAGGPINPVGNALVIIWNPDHVQYTRTDKSGGFFMDDVPEGRYVLYVYARDFFAYKEEVTVLGNEVTYTRIILKPVLEKGHLNGNVYGEEFPGGPITPIRDAKLRLVNHGYTYEGTTDQYGEFNFESIPEGTYALYVNADGWRPYKELVTIRGGQTTYTRILLKPAPEYGALKGVVLERGGGPISGPAKVTVFDQWFTETTITDRSGYFGFEKVPVGTYWVHVYAEKYEELTLRVEILPDQTTEIKIELEPLGG